MKHIVTSLTLFLSLFLLYPTTGLTQRSIPVNIESNPPGATVWLDSTDTTPLGTTPMSSIRIPKGGHTLIFKKENFETARLPIQVRKWRETFQINLVALSTVIITAGTQDSERAKIEIDGIEVGRVPFKTTVKPGRHFLKISKQGFLDFKQWVELAGAQVMTMPIILQKEAVKTGSILVTGNISGAPIYIDGVPKGVTPVLLENIREGNHTVEIKPQNLPPHQVDVLVVANREIKINPQFETTPAPSEVASRVSENQANTGSMKVISNVSNAVISIDGEPVGNPPLAMDLPEGTHFVEVKAEGYKSQQKEVTITASKQSLFVATLESKEMSQGNIIVNTQTPGANVTIDGENKGAPPVVIDQANSGTHAVLIQAPGYKEFRTTCEVQPGKDCKIDARLLLAEVVVQITSNTKNANLFIDGKPMGPIPWEGKVVSGEHRFEVKSPGFQTHVEQVNLTVENSPRKFDIYLSKEGELSEEEAAEAAAEDLIRKRAATSHAAAPLPGSLTVMDGSVGWPFLGQLGLGVGILNIADVAGLEAGFGIRTFGRITEFRAKAKFGYRPIRQFSVGAQVKIGGGIGPSKVSKITQEDGVEKTQSHPTNNFVMDLELLTSLHFNEAAVVTLWLAGDIYSDRWDWSSKDQSVLVSTKRQAEARLRLGGAIEFVVTPYLNVWTILEGIVAEPERRRLYGDILDIGQHDAGVYGQLGVTYKFGTN